ncbi:hypothetical protein CCH79_00000368 [Gambusia affinis]|uniref:protein-tyrosine-phosphatase n=1 Tax=Gambusia affinis TaxID=33528 RepID=A0A315W6M5_GAMAF|nr:hypothetical protein CCH79_00000368 [Gambusia affinis]
MRQMSVGSGNRTRHGCVNDSGPLNKLVTHCDVIQETPQQHGGHRFEVSSVRLSGSPIAEAVFRKMATDAGVVDKWRIDSAATSTYEIGNTPDHRGQACMKRHGVPMSHVARQWVIDSGATSDWNTGSSPDIRGLACLRKHGIETSHRARQVTKDDFMNFEYILCMDESNLSDLNKKAKSVKNSNAKIELLGSYDPQNQRIIKDPYYSLCSTDALSTARGVSGASVLAVCQPRLSSTCFMISTIRLRLHGASPPAAAVGALSPQCSVRAHINNSSPTTTGLRGALIAPV